MIEEFLRGGLSVAIVGWLIVEKFRSWRLQRRVERLEARGRAMGWNI